MCVDILANVGLSWAGELYITRRPIATPYRSLCSRHWARMALNVMREDNEIEN